MVVIEGLRTKVVYSTSSIVHTFMNSKEKTYISYLYIYIYIIMND